MPAPITSSQFNMPQVSVNRLPERTWYEAFMGSPAQTMTAQRYKPEQQQTMDMLRQLAQGQLTGGQFDFGPIEQQARTGFTSKTVPSIMERFASMGGEGTAGSSALKGALGSAGAGLEESLAAMRQQYNLAQQPLLQNLLGMGLQQQQDVSYQPRQPSFFESLLTPLGLGAGYAGVNWLTQEGTQQPKTNAAPGRIEATQGATSGMTPEKAKTIMSIIKLFM